ncbi:hypothetical protein Tco_0339524 [Tanacetum coccineum]
MKHEVAEKQMLLGTKETQLFIEALQDMACDPPWKTDGCFRSNYLCETHKEAKETWDLKFTLFNELELVYERDRATIW